MKLNKTILIVTILAMVLMALTTAVNVTTANDELYSYMEGVKITSRW